MLASYPDQRTRVTGRRVGRGTATVRVRHLSQAHELNLKSAFFGADFRRDVRHYFNRQFLHAYSPNPTIEHSR